MKIVINRCFGGFNLSTLAFDKMLERKEREYEKAPSKISFTQSDFNYWYKGRVNEEGGYISMYTMTQDRADPDLVAVVEELGEKAWGNFSELKVVEIPDDVNWHIADHDGMEHIAENHRIWYGDE